MSVLATDELNVCRFICNGQLACWTLKVQMDDII